jgi:3-hydroxyacyl-[acyl-carrier-protein] dehydratase
MHHTCTIYSFDAAGLARYPRYRKLAKDFGACLETRHNYTRPGLQKVLSRMLLLYVLSPDARKPMEVIDRLRYSPLGAPSLAGGPYFSISHTASLVAMAVSSTVKIGLDIERMEDVSAVAGRLFLHHKEQRFVLSLPKRDRSRVLTGIWTKKEALGKLLELGLSLGFPRVDTTGGPHILYGQEKYTLAEISYTKGVCGHLAYPYGTNLRLRKRQLSITELMKEIEDQVLPEPQQLLPHRDLMLVVDAIDTYTPGESLVARKRIDNDCPFLRGHFPGNPMVPGVILVEMMFQTGGLFTRMERKGGSIDASLRTGKAIKITNVVFRQPVVPGTELKIGVTIRQKLRGFYTFQAVVFSEEGLFAEGEITLSI